MAPNVYKHFSEIYSSLGVIFKEMMVQRPQHRWLAKVVIFNHKKSERIENLHVHRGYAKGIIIVKVKICLSHSLHHRSSVHAGYVYSVQCQSMIVTYINALVLISTQRFLAVSYTLLHKVLATRELLLWTIKAVMINWEIFVALVMECANDTVY